MSKSLGNTLSLLEPARCLRPPGLPAPGPAIPLPVADDGDRGHPGRGRPRRWRDSTPSPGSSPGPRRAARPGRPGALPGAHGRRPRHARRRGRRLRADAVTPEPTSGERASALAAAVFTIFEDALGLPLHERGRRRCPRRPWPRPGPGRGPGRQGLGSRRRPAGRAAGRRLDCRGRTGRDHNSAVSDFERDTAVRRDGDGWTADLQPRWNVGNNPNGGYLLAIAVRAMQEETGRPDPVTVTAHYLSPPADGPGHHPHPDGQAGPHLRHRHGGGGPERTGAGAGRSAPSVTCRNTTARPGSAPVPPTFLRRTSV